MQMDFGTAVAELGEESSAASRGELGARCRIVIADDHTIMREGLQMMTGLFWDLAEDAPAAGQAVR